MKRKQHILLIVLLVLGLFQGVTTHAQTTVSWTYSGAPATWTVPAGVTSITFDVQGGKGEDASDGISMGGNGGRVQGTLAVTPGAVLNIYVGGVVADGTYLSTGGYNGGGGGDGEGTGSGGGASDIRIGGTALTNRVIVAGAGGGAGEDAPDTQDGGAGGGLVGEDGINPDPAAAQGDGGTQTAGGAGGIFIGIPAASGTLGQGGDGSSEWEGGGGGGGYYGGGGGSFAGGGGGSSYTDPTLATSVVHTQGYNTGSGFVSITYSVGCAGTITGPSSVCSGSSISLADATTGGTWSSDNAAIATVSATGSVTAISAGTVNIVYSVTGCPATATASVTVSPLPDAGTISGPSSVCSGSGISLTDAVSGGTWSSSDAAIATVGATGSVTGVSAGTVSIVYSVAGTGGCIGVATTATTSVTVLALPDAGTISGPSSVCSGSSISLTDAASGGTWSSSNAGIAAVGPSGGVTGISAGTVSIVYSVTGTGGCTASTTALVTVSSAPNAGTITGPSFVCAGSDISLADAAPGGTWGSSNAAVATVSATGSVTGISAGIVTIVYSVTGTGGCAAVIATTTAFITVSPLPDAGTISGPSSVCNGSSISLTDAASGGTWSSSDAAIAAVSPSGSVTGIAAGTVSIVYLVTGTGGCTASTTAPVTVLPLPDAGTITGPSFVCGGSDISLADAAPGGTWSSSNAVTATVSASGIVTGISAGTVSIVYSVTGPGGCTASTAASINVSSSPNAGTITGPSSVCAGSDIWLTDATPGGTWSSSDAGIAAINASGSVTGISGGTVTIVYSITGTGGCPSASTTASVTVSSLPDPVISYVAPVLSVANSYATYQWFLDGASIAGATSYTTTATTIGHYSVKVTNGDGCSAISNAYAIGSLAVQGVSTVPVSIYPNPATNMVHIISPVNVHTVISDMQGRTVINAADTKDIDVSKLAAGVYVIMLYDENGQQLEVQKLIKQAN